MSEDVGVEVARMVALVDRLHENLDAVSDVLEGTYGVAIAQVAEKAPKTNRSIEESLALIADKTNEAIERLQGLRERLSKVMRRL